MRYRLANQICRTFGGEAKFRASYETVPCPFGSRLNDTSTVINWGESTDFRVELLSPDCVTASPIQVWY
jgi:hypothetical protein